MGQHILLKNFYVFTWLTLQPDFSACFLFIIVASVEQNDQILKYILPSFELEIYGKVWFCYQIAKDKVKKKFLTIWKCGIVLVVKVSDENILVNFANWTNLLIFPLVLISTNCHSCYKKGGKSLRFPHMNCLEFLIQIAELSTVKKSVYTKQKSATIQINKMIT